MDCVLIFTCIHYKSESNYRRTRAGWDYRTSACGVSRREGPSAMNTGDR